MTDDLIIADRFRHLGPVEKRDYIANLSGSEQRRAFANPDMFLFDKQIIPDEISGKYWLFYLLRCGRSFGKTYAGSAWVAKKIRQGAKIIGLCGPTYDDVAKVMIPAIVSWFMQDELEEPPYNTQTHTLRFKNGAKVYCYTSDKEIRGPNLEYLWCDEICVWADGIPEKIKERFEDITRAVRVGKHPQTLITSTPKTHPFFLDFQDKIEQGNSNYFMVQGSILDNPYLPRQYVEEQVRTFGSNARGRQELYGDLIRDALGAYWTHGLLDDCRSELPTLVPRPPLIPSNDVLMGREPPPDPTLKPLYLLRKLIGFDPAVSKGGDECGIVLVSLYSNGKAYVEGDYSGHYDPGEWSRLINQLYQEHNASAVVVEKNNGGNTFEYTLRTVNAHMNVIPRHTSEGKTIRAEHISALYSQGKVFHTSCYKQLEDQMCSFNVNYSKSPDRIDALGLALTELFWPSQPSSLRSSGIANLIAYR